jgi:hypothetical protein
MTAVQPTSAVGAVELPTHPSEHSRLLLALSASTIVFGGSGILVVAAGSFVALAVFAGVLALFAALVWLGLQIYRARVLGNSIHVTRESVPELQEALDEVRAQLDYHRRVDICVVQKAPHPVMLTSYLGTKVIVFEGALIADLLPERERAQLVFLLSRYIGALKAKHERLTIVFVFLELVTSLKFLFAFLLPYNRATAYTGDQIAMRCCGDLETALDATERLLVGRELQPDIHADGVVTQAGYVRRRLLPRCAQLFQAEPHLTNRYINLLFHARATEAPAWDAFCDRAAPATKDELAKLWQRSPHRRRRSSHARRVVMSGVAAALTAAALGGIALAAPSSPDESGGTYAEPVDETPVPVDTPGPSAPTPEPVVPTPDPVQPDDPHTELASHVPERFRDSCDPAPAGAATAAVDCTPLGERTPATARYYQFADQATMDADFSTYGEALQPRDCPGGQTTWSSETSGGHVGCFTDTLGSNYIVWTDDTLLILGYAETILVGPKGLYDWWLDDSGPV